MEPGWGGLYLPLQPGCQDTEKSLPVGSGAWEPKLLTPLAFFPSLALGEAHKQLGSGVGEMSMNSGQATGRPKNLISVLWKYNCFFFTFLSMRRKTHD